MRKYQERLTANERQARIEGAKYEEYGYYRQRKTRSKRNTWGIVYMSTVFATVVTVTLLLIFGVGSGNRALREGLRVSSIADTVLGWFSRLDFPMLGEADGTPQDTPTDSDTDKDTGKPSVNKPKPPSAEVGGSVKDIYDFDYSAVPEGCIPIVPMDLSLTAFGELYINNSTGYTPDVSWLLQKNLSDKGVVMPLSASKAPQVLIVHTHASEAYLDEGTVYLQGDEDYSRSADTSKNVVSVGKIIADALNAKGIATAHCTVMHDSVQYKDSYARAEETIRKYLEEFPTIKLVIDVHRDSVVRSNGDIVRPVASYDDSAAAQIMCVVGSDWEGDANPNWENNLSLALKLRRVLNSKCSNICRPVFLKGHTYNQEIAPMSLLLEVGASGNSLAEAHRSAALLGESLSELLCEIL